MKVLRGCTNAFGKIIPKPQVRSGTYVPSMYNFIVHADEIVLTNTLSRCIVTLTQEDEALLTQKELIVDAQTCSDTVRAMIQLRILIPAGEDECKLYQELYEILYLMSANRGKSSYKIFTTTACNARCFYCFEQGTEVKTMSDDTTDALFDYIMKTKRDGSILLYWFGGEPLCNTRTINRLCTKLQQAGVPYTSRIVTNGFLFDQEMVNEAISLWNLKQCQITLDGMHEEYKRRKNYKSNPEDPFETVVHNIELLAEQKVHMDIRLNFDYENIDEILTLKDYLKVRLGKYETVYIYPAPIFDEWFGYSAPVSLEKKQKMREVSALIRDEAAADDMQFSACMSENLPSSRCMSNNTDWAIIAPDGRLFTCQAHCDELCYGDIWQGVTNRELYEAWTHNTEPLPQCKKCPMLPQCTAFHLCPTGNEGCFAKRSDLFKRQMLNSYQALRKEKS